MRSTESFEEEPVVEESASGRINMDKMNFVLVLLALISAGVWLGFQYSPAGFTTAGRYSITYGVLFAALCGIIIPKVAPKVTGGILGALLLGLGIGMLGGIFLPGLIAKIPPDTVTAIVAWFNGGMILGQDWGLGPLLTIVILILFVAMAYALGIALRWLAVAFWSWLTS